MGKLIHHVREDDPFGNPINGRNPANGFKEKRIQPKEVVENNFFNNEQIMRRAYINAGRTFEEEINYYPNKIEFSIKNDLGKQQFEFNEKHENLESFVNKLFNQIASDIKNKQILELEYKHKETTTQSNQIEYSGAILVSVKEGSEVKYHIRINLVNGIYDNTEEDKEEINKDIKEKEQMRDELMNHFNGKLF